MRTFLLSFLFLTVYSNSFAAHTYFDKSFKSNIKTVRLFKDDGSIETIFNSAITSLDQSQPLVLEFDELADAANYYYAKIIHCNADWTKSNLADAEFMNQYNEFLISNYDFSNNTAINYTHYKWQIPRVNFSGNYAVMVYNSENPSDTILTRRFMIIENIVGIKTYFSYTEMVGSRDTHQQTAFELQHDQLNLVNPSTEIQVCIRQNQRWDNAKYGLKPLFINDTEKILDFRYFDESVNFEGWNEFRSFGSRNNNFEDINVKLFDQQKGEVWLEPVKTRSDRTYVNYIDLNGKFVIENSAGQNDLQSQYFNTKFLIESEEIEQKVYLIGAFTDWIKKDPFECPYFIEYKGYLCEVLLKQGFYDYMYLVNSNADDIKEWHFEGSHFRAQNEYEIIVYFREIGGRKDRIVGYLKRNFFN